MKLYLKELKKYVDLSNIEIDDIIYALNMIGYEVENVAPIVKQINLHVGEILSIEPHPNADKLNIAQVKVKDKKYQIICGAPNVVDAKYVVVVLPGTELNNMMIEERKLRGIKSQGMICSLKEIGVPKELLSEKEQDGIIILGKTAENNALKEMNLDSYIIEIAILKNRYAAYSYIEIAKELSWRLNVDFLFKNSPVIATEKNNVKLTIKEGVEEYNVIKIHGINIKESDWSIKSVLYAAGIKPINNLVDIGNYVSLILKQPMHVFDGAFGNDIQVKKVPAKLTTLNGTDYNLSNKVLCVTNDQNKIGSVAGVIGSNLYEINNDTKFGYVESAVFTKEEIENSENTLNISTDSSTLFKKNMTGCNSEKALNLFISIAYKTDSIQSFSKIVSYKKTKIKDRKILVSLSTIESYLGKRLEEKEVIELLELNSHKHLTTKKEVLEFSVPYNEQFINSEASLIEELIRIYGVEKINNTPSLEYFHINYINKNEIKISNIRNQMLTLGMSEIISYTLVEKNINDEFNPFRYKKAFELDKHYSLLKNQMRFSLIPSLLETSDENRRHKKNITSLFEISDIYNGTNKQTHIAGLLYGDYIKNIINPLQKIGGDIYVARYFIETIKSLIDSNIDLLYEPVKTKFKLAQQTNILLDKEVVGYIGNNLKQNEIVFELNLNLLMEYKQKEFKYTKIGVTNINNFDYSFVLKDIKQIREIILSIKNIQYVIDVEVIDIYENETFTIRVFCQNKEKTLSSKDNKKLKESLVNVFKSQKIILK